MGRDVVGEPAAGVVARLLRAREHPAVGTRPDHPPGRQAVAGRRSAAGEILQPLRRRPDDHRQGGDRPGRQGRRDRGRLGQAADVRGQAGDHGSGRCAGLERPGRLQGRRPRRDRGHDVPARHHPAYDVAQRRTPRPPTSRRTATSPTPTSSRRRPTTNSRLFLAGIDVAMPQGRSVVLFGDSITDGDGSTPNEKPSLAGRAREADRRRRLRRRARQRGHLRRPHPARPDGRQTRWRGSRTTSCPTRTPTPSS